MRSAPPDGTRPWLPLHSAGVAYISVFTACCLPARIGGGRAIGSDAGLLFSECSHDGLHILSQYLGQHVALPVTHRVCCKHRGRQRRPPYEYHYVLGTWVGTVSRIIWRLGAVRGERAVMTVGVSRAPLWNARSNCCSHSGHLTTPLSSLLFVLERHPKAKSYDTQAPRRP